MRCRTIASSGFGLIKGYDLMVTPSGGSVINQRPLLVENLQLANEATSNFRVATE